MPTKKRKKWYKRNKFIGQEKDNIFKKWTQSLERKLKYQTLNKEKVEWEKDGF